MRIVESWTTKEFKTTIYSMDLWFTVEFEAGPMKQAYKFMKATYPTVGAVKDALRPEFLAEVYASFEKMFLAFKAHAAPGEQA